MGAHMPEAPDLDLDDSQARAEIFGRVRALMAGPKSHPGVARDKALDYMRRHPRGPAPLPVDDVVALFVQRAQAMLSTVEPIAAAELLPQACWAVMKQQGLGTPRVSVWPALSGLDWGNMDVPVEFGAPKGDELVTVSAVAHAVAETGTLVFASAPEQPASTHLLPETHFALVRQSQIVHTMEEVFERMRGKESGMPRALNFVSGPSRTADIEQTIVLGAHGPYRVHIFLLDDLST